jgi:hypothetical protein
MYGVDIDYTVKQALEWIAYMSSPSSIHMQPILIRCNYCDVICNIWLSNRYVESHSRLHYTRETYHSSIQYISNKAQISTSIYCMYSVSYSIRIVASHSRSATYTILISSAHRSYMLHVLGVLLDSNRYVESHSRSAILTLLISSIQYNEQSADQHIDPTACTLYPIWFESIRLTVAQLLTLLISSAHRSTACSRYPTRSESMSRVSQSLSYLHYLSARSNTSNKAQISTSIYSVSYLIIYITNRSI